MICFIIFSETTSLPAVTSELQQTIEKRIANYRTAISNAKEMGESAKIRRYERGLKVSGVPRVCERVGGEVRSLKCSSEYFQMCEFVERGEKFQCAALSYFKSMSCYVLSI